MTHALQRVSLRECCVPACLTTVPVRFVLTQSLVCNGNFQSLGLRKHPKVSLAPIRNVAGWLPLSLVNRALDTFAFQAPAFMPGRLTVEVFLEVSVPPVKHADLAAQVGKSERVQLLCELRQRSVRPIGQEPKTAR